MELKTQLNKPYTENEKFNFIVENNHTLGYEIKETDEALEAWGLTEEEAQALERERLDALWLTPSDVERALYNAKGMDFEDLKTLISQTAPQLDMKALSIEFRANAFYRGATIKTTPAENETNENQNGTIRLIDTVGALLGYTPEDMDYLFINKQLPQKTE